MDEKSLTATLAAFFLDSMQEDAGDVENWCSQSGNSADDIVAGIERYLKPRE